MAKAELFDIWGFRWLITGMHAYPVKRGAADRAALKRTLDYLAGGEIVCVFPEGTRSIDGQVGPLEIGVGMLAVKSGAPIVPVAIRGTDQMLPRGAKRLYRSKIRVEFGPPLHLPASLNGRTDREAYQEATDRIRTALLSVVSGQK
jgi:1-acyl-sn-glycerol-3-phosphate acyltransferase